MINPPLPFKSPSHSFVALWMGWTLVFLQNRMFDCKLHFGSTQPAGVLLVPVPNTQAAGTAYERASLPHCPPHTGFVLLTVLHPIPSHPPNLRTEGGTTPPATCYTLRQRYQGHVLNSQTTEQAYGYTIPPKAPQAADSCHRDTHRTGVSEPLNTGADGDRHLFERMELVDGNVLH